MEKRYRSVDACAKVHSILNRQILVKLIGRSEPGTIQNVYSTIGYRFICNWRCRASPESDNLVEIEASGVKVTATVRNTIRRGNPVTDNGDG